MLPLVLCHHLIGGLSLQHTSVIGVFMLSVFHLSANCMRSSKHVSFNIWQQYGTWHFVFSCFNNDSSFVLVSLPPPVCSSMCVDVPHPVPAQSPVTVSPTDSHTTSLCTPCMITVLTITAYHMLGPCCDVVVMYEKGHSALQVI